MDSSPEPQRTTIRLDPGIRERINRWRRAHHGPSLTVAVNMLLDEMLTAEGYPATDSAVPGAHQHPSEE